MTKLIFKGLLKFNNLKCLNIFLIIDMFTMYNKLMLMQIINTKTFDVSSK